MPMDTNLDKVITQEEEQEWFQRYWRPAMAWQYMAVCVFDFIVAPIMYTIYAQMTKSVLVSWESITLSNGGFYHIAMMAIIGISAWTRGQEKIDKMTLATDIDLKKLGKRVDDGPEEEDDESSLEVTATAKKKK